MTDSGIKYLLYGGCINSNSEASYSFDPKTNEWSNVHFPPRYPLLESHSATSSARSVIIYGGKKNSKINGENKELNTELIVYKDRYGWKRIPSFSKIPSRSHHVSILLNNELLV